MGAWETQRRVLEATCGGAVNHPPQLPLSFLQDLLHKGADGAQASSAQCFYEHLGNGIRAHLQECLSGSPDQRLAGLEPLLQAGVKCLHVFVRHNMSGPWLTPPPSPIQLLAPALSSAPAAPPNSESDGAPAPPQPSNTSLCLGDDTRHPHERWAAQKLALDGEDVLGGISALQYLVLSNLLLVQPLLETPQLATAKARSPATALGWAAGVREQVLPAWPSLPWWALRVTAVHQQVLDGRSAQLWVRTQLLCQQVLSAWAMPAMQIYLGPQAGPPQTPEGLAQLPPGVPSALDECVVGLAGQPAMLACVFMECALGHYAYGHVGPGQRLLEDAGAVLGLEVQLTGALGKRTVHQIDAKAQLIVMASRSRRLSPDQSCDVDVTSMTMGVDWGDTGPESEGRPVRETDGLQPDEDVYMAPVLVDEEGKELDSIYSGVEQALLLSWAKHVKTATAQDELQVWQVAPYVEAVLRQHHSQPILQAHAHLLKIQHEATRNRTRERALLHMEQLVEVLNIPAITNSTETEQNQQQAGKKDSETDQSAERRFPFVHCTGFPLSTRLRKELANQYVALGFVGAAVKLFESLEAWDALVVCYRLMDKKHMAEEIIRKRLLVTPNDPSLWCGLGDLHLDDSYYEIAWERSKHRHARSKRSLGQSALRRKDWSAATNHYEAALALNPLNPDAWFALGYAYLKMKDQQLKALKAFTRVTQQQPDHGEAWNNLAALFIDIGKLRGAYSALSHCVKLKHDSWQVWENYASVAVRVGEYVSAANACKQVLHLSQGQRIPLNTVRDLVDAMDNPLDNPLDTPAQPEIGTAPGSGVEDAQGKEGDDLGAWVLDLPGLPSLAMPAMGAGYEGPQGDGQALRGDVLLTSQSQYEKDVEDANERSRQKLRTMLSQLLKEAVNLPCCTGPLWGCLGKYYNITGELESSKEAYLKQVRALTGTSYKSDETRFIEMANASTALAEAYITLYEASIEAAREDSGAAVPAKPATRELGAARMQLRGVLKQCEAFSDHPAWLRMDEVLKRVMELEGEAMAASQA